MPVLPNSHEALLRNRSALSGHLALIGPSHIALLADIASEGVAVTENVAHYDKLSGAKGWTVAFGYDSQDLCAQSANTVVVFLPKSRAELAVRLALGHWLVAAGGQLLLVGEKKEGISGAAKQLKALFPAAEKIDSARHCQVWRVGSLTPRAEFDLGEWMSWHTVESDNTALAVAHLPGVFSESELDEGTALLLGTLADSPLPEGPVLDFACGAGVIGGWLQARQRDAGHPANEVDGVDVQSQAVTCARATYARAGAIGEIWASDGLSQVEKQYRAVVTNPPFHSGVKTDTSMTEAFLMSVKKHLLPGGELRLVANRFLPYEPLIRRHVGKVSVLAENGRFIVWSAVRG